MKKLFLNSSMNLITKKNNYTQEEIDMIAYGLEGIYLTFTKMIIILIIAFLLQTLKEVIILLISYNIIRSQAFGIHASKSIYCLISSILLFVGGSIICKYITLPLWLMITIAIICNICLFIYAPADTKKRPLINSAKRKRFKILSSILGIIYTILIILFHNNFITNYLLLGMFEAVISILPITYKIFKLPYNNYKNYNYVV